jgi:hypothetical protein
MATMSDLLPRRAQSIVFEALEDTCVVLINGARQAGKSTLTRVAANRRGLRRYARYVKYAQGVSIIN